jgi:hypothetical protein
MFAMRYGQTNRVELNFKRKTGRRIMSRIVIVLFNFIAYNYYYSRLAARSSQF